MVNSLVVGSAGAMVLDRGWRLAVGFHSLDLAVGVNGLLRLLSGDNRFTPGGFDVDFDLDEQGEFFDLEIDGNFVGRFGCYEAFGIINLNGDMSGEGCAFDREFLFVRDFGLSLAALINGDRQLIIDAIFSEAVALSSVGNHLTVVLRYGTGSLAVVPVPAPAAVLPVISGLAVVGKKRLKKIENDMG
ncbi:hypothetical protein NIES208_13425 [[Limnothrix rosea] IAM M-220]|nr:hypothetical protein NIES208_13425 [[Limnothrix rosea] IAM M-220]